MGLGSKQKGLRDHSKLELNRRLLDDHPTHWNEETVEKRAKSLFEIAAVIWPSGDAMKALMLSMTG